MCHWCSRRVLGMETLVPTDAAICQGGSHQVGTPIGPIVWRAMKRQTGSWEDRLITQSLTLPLLDADLINSSPSTFSNTTGWINEKSTDVNHDNYKGGGGQGKKEATPRKHGQMSYSQTTRCRSCGGSVLWDFTRHLSQSDLARGQETNLVGFHGRSLGGTSNTTTRNGDHEKGHANAETKNDCRRRFWRGWRRNGRSEQGGHGTTEKTTRIRKN